MIIIKKWRFFIPRTGRPDASRAANLFLRKVLQGNPIGLVFRPPSLQGMTSSEQGNEVETRR